ncbi:MAG TPA: hypothetical protein GXX55_01820 [Firmicutes bacterium]|nr:hypothetical protein [Bacillota bacterium]
MRRVTARAFERTRRLSAVQAGPGGTFPGHEVAGLNKVMVMGRCQAMEPREFVRFLYPAARTVQAETGISAAAMIAQAALETGWLQAPVKDRYDGRPAYNLFNLKGQGPAGSVRALDSEHHRSERQTVEHYFRAYRSYEESFRDYADLILNSPRYRRAAEVRHDAVAFLKELAAAGYATDPAYVQKLESILRRHVWPALAELESENSTGSIPR